MRNLIYRLFKILGIYSIIRWYHNMLYNKDMKNVNLFTR
jgi:hypothetical protein